MSERLIKPYEISVWEEEVTQNGFNEKKLAIIGSDTMTGLNKVFDPVFNKKTNGEKSLSFSLNYKYFDPYSGDEDVVNPFAGLLTNERKVKLLYDGEWYEFIVKDHSESSDGYVWSYTCNDAFITELSKIGYNVTFDTELNNNQGTAFELAKETVKDTSWRIGTTDVGRQLVDEPIYKATISSPFQALNVDTQEVETCDGEIYLFYTYVKNRDGRFVQFIKQANSYVIDNKNVITATNYRILQDTEITDTDVKLNGNTIITIGEVESRYQAKRIVYSQLTTYDPVMGRTVERFKSGDLDVYKYTDYTYTTSNVVVNYIVNGENFNVLEDGSMQGWSAYVDHSAGDIVNLELVTRPQLKSGKELADLTTISQVEGFLKAHFNAGFTNYKNAIFNSGFEYNCSFIEHVSKGEKFVFRWRAGYGEDVDDLTDGSNLRAIVAKFTEEKGSDGKYYKYIDPDNIILRFEGSERTLNNVVTGGYIRTEVVDGKTIYNYIIDDIVQNVSTRYVYENSTDGRQYIWNLDNKRFDLLTSLNYIPYHYLVATATKSIPNSELKEIPSKYGIFIYNTNRSGYYHIQDIQLTRFIPDGSDPTKQTPIIMGNVPTATSNARDYYYIKPDVGAAAEDVATYASADALAQDKGLSDPIEPIYNENAEKYLTISASKSNCFDILQTIAETFECWVDLDVKHDPETGYIEKDADGQLKKYICLREYVGKDNYAGFKYGINLDTIERTINSEEIVTKLIVDQSQSDYVDEGYVSISLAPSNTSGESYILNFDYYYSQGLLDKETVEPDRLEFIRQIADYNRQLNELGEKQRSLENSLLALGAKRNVYTELILKAREMHNKALGRFEKLTHMTYEEYREQEIDIEEWERLSEEETVLEVLGELYISCATINNYSGLLTNIEQEYWKVRKELNGSENYRVKVWVDRDIYDTRHVYVELNDYLPGFNFDIGGSNYESTVSKKFFDIESDSTYIVFHAPSGFTMDQYSYNINDSKTVTFKITSNQTYDGVVDRIDDLYDEKEQLTKDFNQRYERYLLEGTWNSTDYVDSERYYLDALQISNTSAQPNVEYSIKVVEVSQLEGLEFYQFDTGDKTYIEDTEFFGWATVNGVLTPAREEVIITEVEWHLDEPNENTITVQNYKTRFEDLFQRISATVQTVQYNEATYAKTTTFLDANGTINQDILLDSLNKISGRQYALTSDGAVMIDGDNILIQNLTNTANRVIINSEGIRVSSDGGLTWSTAIDGQGINIGAVYTGTLNTNEVIIGNEENPSFRWDKAGISAFKSDSEFFVKTTDLEVDESKEYYIYNDIADEYVLVDDPVDEEIDTYYEKHVGYDLQTFVRYDQYGLYGIKKNGAFKAQSLQDVINKAHFAVTWDGFFIKNSYEGGGRVSLTSDNDFQVLDGNSTERIKIGSLGVVSGERQYGIKISNVAGAPVMQTDNTGNITITGTLNALGGNFTGVVNVGSESQDHIIIDGNDASIRTSNYQSGAGYGWLINKDGDAVFNNITARGAIKTAVFEYSEIQAVGGVFLFRPSSTIRSASISESDLVLTVEKPLFKVGDWCKVSNYTGNGVEPSASGIVSDNGLVHTYKVIAISNRDVTLEGAAAMVEGQSAITDLDSLQGGALVDMGDKANGDGKVGNSNYGIGINSSDNTVNLPRRAISLFETIINESHNPKVSYNYRAILGTLPPLQYTGVNPQVNVLYHNNLEEEQGIYTNNIYIGDSTQYLAYYYDKTAEKRRLRISGADIIFTYDDGQGGVTEESLDDHIVDIAGEGGEGYVLSIDSSGGYIFDSSNITSTLTAHLFKNGEEITPYSAVTALGFQINWYVNGTLDSVNGVDTATYAASGIDSINITAKLEDISNG